MALLGLLHIMATFFYFYWTYWWFDWITHFLAGLAGGLAAYWALFNSSILRNPYRRVFPVILIVFLCVMAAGAAWEIFEYAIDVTDSYEAVYALDVFHDLLADALGAIVAAFIGIKHTLGGSTAK